MSISAETFGVIEIYAIRNQNSLLKYYDSTMEHESKDFGWIFGIPLTSTDCTAKNL